jgi:hypothetical protein
VICSYFGSRRGSRRWMVGSTPTASAKVPLNLLRFEAAKLENAG